jgi:hypothetical protein
VFGGSDSLSLQGEVDIHACHYLRRGGEVAWPSRLS